MIGWTHFSAYLFYFLGDKPLGDREMLLKKKRASTTDLSNNGDDQNLPDDDMGKFLKFLKYFSILGCGISNLMVKIIWLVEMMPYVAIFYRLIQ